MRGERIPVAAPSITEREVELAAEAARSAWGANHYAFNARFERMVADYIGVAHAVSLPHATSGLHLALAALGIGPGDEVICPDVTWIASVAPVTYVGATPVLVDIRPDTWCIDPVAVEDAITPRTKAIIGVDLYGSTCDWADLALIANMHDLALIEDAAQAMGSIHHGARAGVFGDASVFSFHGSKTITTGEGGMLVTNKTSLYDRVLTLRDHGRPVGDRLFQNDEIAFKYKMPAVAAALGCAQMERIDELIETKRHIFRAYAERLAGLPITLNAQPDDTLNSYWMVTAIPDPYLEWSKFGLMQAMSERGIDTRPFFSPLSSLPAFFGRAESKRRVRPPPTASVFGINLPSGYDMDESKVDRVCAALTSVLGLTSSRRRA